MDRFALVKRNTEEILTDNDLKKLLKDKKQPSAYYGVASTGPFHMAYMIPLTKFIDFSKAGIRNKILVADIHAALDDLKTPWEEIDKRAEYYKKCVELAFPWEKKPEFITGSSYQFDKKYVLDVLKITSISTVTRAQRAASEVCRLKNPKVSELLYPIMQSMDEVGLNVDIQLGGIDQRHIFAFAREFLPRIGHKARVHVMTPMVASIRGPGTKMSASEPTSHIKVYDSEEKIKQKMNNAYCPAGDVKENPVTQLCKFIIFSIKTKIKIERPKKFGGDITFKAYEELEKEFLAKKLHPADLKLAVSNELISIFSKARNYFEKNQDMLKKLGKDFL